VSLAHFQKKKMVFDVEEFHRDNTGFKWFCYRFKAIMIYDSIYRPIIEVAVFYRHRLQKSTISAISANENSLDKTDRRC
jgi:hypothetical protein